MLSHAPSAAIRLIPLIPQIRDDLGRLASLKWMLWNTVLALTPAVLALAFFARNETPRRRNAAAFAIQLGLVLIFLPNAPYVATDLVHFLQAVRASAHSPWRLLATDFPLYMGFVLVGLTSYAFTEDRMLFVIDRQLGRAWSLSALVLIPFVSAIGVYLGRVARFNSWDLFEQPTTIARSGGRALVDLRMLTIIVCMAALLFLVHQVYRVFHDGLRYRGSRRQPLGHGNHA